MMIKLYLNDCDIMTIPESFCPFLFIDSHMRNYDPTLVLIFPTVPVPFLLNHPTNPQRRQENRSELKELGASEEEVLTELRRQRQERLKAPEESLLRAQRIQTLHGG